MNLVETYPSGSTLQYRGNVSTLLSVSTRSPIPPCVKKGDSWEEFYDVYPQSPKTLGASRYH